MAKFFKVPFAATGDKASPPDATQPDGSVSYAQGFGFDYERKTDGTDPLAKPVPRNSTNGIFNDITGAVGEIQLNGFALWRLEGAPYPLNAVVRHSNKVWRSLIDNNSITPAEGGPWTETSILLYSQSQVDAKLAIKADKATTLGGYGITDAYTVEYMDGLLAQKATKSTTLGGYGIADAYTITQTDNLLANKANKATTAGGYGITDVYTVSYMDGLLALKADKATTLAGYGITDAFRITNPLPAGYLDFRADIVAFVSGGTEAWLSQNMKWSPSGWTKLNASLPGAAIRMSGGGAFVARMPASGTATVDSEIIDKSMQATNSELDTGSSDSKWPSVAGVTRMLGRTVVPASEVASGIAPIATQAAVNAGADDAQIVTPKKLRFGISYSFTQNGYIALPQWMGGLILQWGKIYESQNATDYRTYPIPFPTQCMGMVGTLESSTDGGMAANYGIVMQVVDRTKFLWSAAGTFAGEGYIYMFAWGN